MLALAPSPHRRGPVEATNVDETELAKPALDLRRRMDAVIARRIAVEGVEDVVVETEPLGAEGKDHAEISHEHAVGVTVGPRHEGAAEPVERGLGNARGERDPRPA